MLSNINKHFFPDSEYVFQTFVYLRGEVTVDSCANIIEQIITLNMPELVEEDGEDILVQPRTDVINLLISSPGGDMSAAFALINTIKGSSIPVRTIALGNAESAGLCILMAGHQRVATPYTTLMSHEFNSGMEASYSGIKHLIKEFDEYYAKMLRFYKENTGLDEDFITKILLSEKDCYLTPEKAQEYNIVDVVMGLR
jgi:ATP-dependent protease ClpP protease subunit